MEKTFITLLIAGILSLQSCDEKKQQTKDNNIPTIKNPYLGQKPPGLRPLPFAPGIVSTDLYEVNSAFTPDMKAFYFIISGLENKKSAFYV